MAKFEEKIEEFAREISYDLNDPLCAILEKDKIEYAVKKGYEKGYEDCRHYAHDYYKPKWHEIKYCSQDLPPRSKDNHLHSVTEWLLSITLVF